MIGFDTADMRGRANAKPRDYEKTESISVSPASCVNKTH